MSDFITKDSGERDDFETGARRDTETGKPRWHNIPMWRMNELNIKYGGTTVLVDKDNTPITDFAPENQCRYDLIPPLALNRLAALYGRGAIKYDDNNWQKGIPLRRVFGSLLRHAYLWWLGDTSEDHLAAIIWNAITLMWTEWAVSNGFRPNTLIDAGPMYIRNWFPVSKEYMERHLNTYFTRLGELGFTEASFDELVLWARHSFDDKDMTEDEIFITIQELVEDGKYRWKDNEVGTVLSRA